VVDSCLAEDVAQEAFTRAWHHAGTYDPRRGSVPSRPLAITRKLAIDAVRLQARRVVAATPYTVDLEATGAGASPAEAAETAEDVVRLRAALAGLPHKVRREVGLACLFARSAREASETEGIPLGTAKTRSGMLKLRLTVDRAGVGVQEEVTGVVTSADCQAFEAMASELALDVLSGDERGAALAHLARCPSCSATLDDLAQVADHLLLLAPIIQPPIGFETRPWARSSALLSQRPAARPPGTGVSFPPV
jgi:RNA polymerase sigma-70 factor (ECF subfamily)